mmetsp:Transcript_28722/g.99104  ORF Transcript_28722/g.99104 Transcript_28722/m.99104 type:complete len:250 (+) Transcript_28722:2131-2880(+)
MSGSGRPVTTPLAKAGRQRFRRRRVGLPPLHSRASRRCRRRRSRQRLRRPLRRASSSSRTRAPKAKTASSSTSAASSSRRPPRRRRSASTTSAAPAARARHALSATTSSRRDARPAHGPPAKTAPPTTRRRTPRRPRTPKHAPTPRTSRTACACPRRQSQKAPIPGGVRLVSEGNPPWRKAFKVQTHHPISHDTAPGQQSLWQKKLPQPSKAAADGPHSRRSPSGLRSPHIPDGVRLVYEGPVFPAHGL